MAEGDAELLEAIRRTRSGWGEDDFDRLYHSYGFDEIAATRTTPGLRSPRAPGASCDRGSAPFARQRLRDDRDPPHRHVDSPPASEGARGYRGNSRWIRKSRYVALPWRVVIEPEQQDDGTVIYVASHPEFDGVLGTGETPEGALTDLQAARRSMIEALLAEGYPIPEPALIGR